MKVSKSQVLFGIANTITYAAIPLRVVAYPYILVCRLVRRIANAAARAEFISRGMCGGCGKFGTKACRRHVKNPYSVMPNKDCYSTH